MEQKNMRDVVGLPLSILFYSVGFRGSYHRMGGTVSVEKLENGQVVECTEAEAMWEQMCFDKDRIKPKKSIIITCRDIEYIVYYN